ncbi:MAG: AMP-binding protein [Acidimicrobiales bacterium]
MPRWQLRTVDAALERTWVDNGWWTDETLGQLLFDGLAAGGSQPFTVRSQVRPSTTTLGAVRRDAMRLAAGLGARGIGAGSVVSFQLPNWLEAAHVFYAATALGATVVPIVHFYGAKEVGYILTRTPPDAYVTFEGFGALSGTATLTAAVAGGAPMPPLVSVVGGPESIREWYAEDAIAAPAPADPSAPALVAYTSGTTAAPKGVIHSHRTIGFECRQLSSVQPRGARAAIVGAPVGHGIGMLAALLIPVVQRKPIHLIDVWDPGTVLAQMEQGGLLAGTGATYFLTSLLDHPDFDPAVHAPLMSHIGLGGSAVPAAVGERSAALGISTVRMYGSTEHPSITGCTHDDPLAKRIATDGRPLLGCELRTDDGGELLSRGPDCFMGYTDPALTHEAFDDDGWYRTEDVGTFDEDGYLTITDRVKDVIIRGGENISASEVEEILARVPGVLEVAVVAAPDARLGEHVCAFVRGVAPTLAQVHAAMSAAGLAKQKWPEEIREVDALPRTPSGKVMKVALRQQLRDVTQ